MSSIYRKGRDGYYYYQTYVINPETGKKNKRLFHSLNTKEQSEAELQQKELDLKYEKEQTYILKKSESIFPLFIEHKITILLMVATAVTTIFIMNIFYEISKEKITQEYTNNLAELNQNLESKLQSESALAENIKSQEFSMVEGDTNTIVKQIKQKPKVLIPEFEIVRTEHLSGAFNQGKVFVTINDIFTTEGLRVLCQKLQIRYKEYSNIIICLYTDDVVGRALANGLGKTFSLREQKTAWLAMYSYNPVEGEYFNDNPTGYISTQ